MAKTSREQNWRPQSETATKDAEKLPQGPERDALIKLARQMATAADMDAWLSSPGLQSPT